MVRKEKMYVVVRNLRTDKAHIMLVPLGAAGHILDATRFAPGSNFLVRSFTSEAEALAYAGEGAEVLVVDEGTILK